MASIWISSIADLLILWLTCSCFKACEFTFDSSNSGPINVKITSGYNDVLGPDINLTYNDQALSIAIKQLNAGALRHPGGTVSDYWSFKNATYVQPCKTSEYNVCNMAEKVNKLPKQTFSPAKFTDYIGKQLLGFNMNGNTNDIKAINIIYDLNLLTLSSDDMLNQIDVIHDALSEALNINDFSHLRVYIEFGNEYYLDSYQYAFPNATSYLETALPVLEYAKQVFNNASLAVIASYDKPHWTAHINDTAYSKYFDSITIHDYSLHSSMLDGMNSNQQLEFIASYGQAYIPSMVKFIKNTFKDFSKTPDIWITEFNLSVRNNTISNGIIHAMYVMSYLASSVCNRDIIKMLLLHVHSGQYGLNNNQQYDATVFLPGLANQTDVVAFNIVGQLYAHLNYIGMIENRDRMYCLKLSDEKDCPHTIVDVSRFTTNNVSCVFGIGFTKKSNENDFGFMMLNACSNEIDVTVHVPGDESVKKNITLWTYSYDLEMEQRRKEKEKEKKKQDEVEQGFKLFKDCEQDGKMQNVWECGPIIPAKKTFAIEKELWHPMPAFSIVLVTTNE